MVGVIVRDQDARQRAGAQRSVEQGLPGGARRRVVEAGVEPRATSIAVPGAGGRGCGKTSAGGKVMSCIVSSSLQLSRVAARDGLAFPLIAEHEQATQHRQREQRKHDKQKHQQDKSQAAACDRWRG